MIQCSSWNKEGDKMDFYPKSTEGQECKAFYQWALLHPLIGSHIIHIPNEGKRSKSYGKTLKDMGLRPGIPDYFLAIPNEYWHGLWLEMKPRRLEGKPIPIHQLEWIDKLNKQNYYATVVFGWEQAASIVKKYLNNLL